GVALCTACSSPVGQHSTPTAPDAAHASSIGPSTARALAPVVDGPPVGASRTTDAAMHAFGAIWIAVPYAAYGGVVPGGGAGITVSLLPGRTDPNLALLMRQARRAGVIVQVRQVHASLAHLEALADRGIVAKLPQHLRDHLVGTQVDIENNRVVASFDVPLDADLRAAVGDLFGDEVAVAFGQPAFAL
ncbi:MAG TPA: hypothetical protein VFL59_06580, partial [Candidatus Nanopelagicales bacterium]|nr:hypothetical protein [Candidatus Nanopelagicales bacterium]